MVFGKRSSILLAFLCTLVMTWGLLLLMDNTSPTMSHAMEIGDNGDISNDEMKQPTGYEVGGVISGVWDIAHSPYIIITDTFVLASEVLTIEPGVEIRFDGHYKLVISGTLIAQGTPTEMILFTRHHLNDDSRGWGIRFHDATEQTSILSYCIIEQGYASNGEWDASPDDRGGGIFVSESNLLVEHCQIRNNTATTGGGLYASMYWGGNLIIRNNLFENNTAFWHGYSCSEKDLGVISTRVRFDNHPNMSILAL
ncbi:MAG: right-handed parallel beta-helix repeat-containing protein, partial [Anaerolineae bacterium]|nr:right-handed parallel beta-helix repeat-containing protein [Anaerolineae bacterium]